MNLPVIGQMNTVFVVAIVFGMFLILTAMIMHIIVCVRNHDAEGTYGYKITQDVRQAIEISESTLYPVLRRLQKDGCLETYDMEYGGRNRRYYRITEAGAAQLNLYKSEWRLYSEKISKLFEGSEEK